MNKALPRTKLLWLIAHNRAKAKKLRKQANMNDEDGHHKACSFRNGMASGLEDFCRQIEDTMRNPVDETQPKDKLTK